MQSRRGGDKNKSRKTETEKSVCNKLYVNGLAIKRTFFFLKGSPTRTTPEVFSPLQTHTRTHIYVHTQHTLGVIYGYCPGPSPAAGRNLLYWPIYISSARAIYSSKFAGTRPVVASTQLLYCLDVIPLGRVCVYLPPY